MDMDRKKYFLPSVIENKINIQKNLSYSKSNLNLQQRWKKWTQVSQFLEIFSRNIILTQPAVVSLWALHGTGRELLLISRSLQDFWLKNISSAQYFKISIQPSLSHLSHFEEKSTLVLWQEPRQSQARAPGNTQPFPEFPGSPELLVEHPKGQPGCTRKLCRQTCPMSALVKVLKLVQTDQEKVLVFLWQIKCISLVFLLNSRSVFFKLKNVQ